MLNGVRDAVPDATLIFNNVNDFPTRATATQAPVDTTTGMESRRMGGLGIHLVRTMMDDVRYERIDGHNRLVMVARLGKHHPAG